MRGYLSGLPKTAAFAAFTPSSRAGNQRGAEQVHKEDCPPMSRNYEAVYIFDSTLEDAAINDKITRFHGLLSATEQPEVSHWGRRQLQ